MAYPQSDRLFNLTDIGTGQSPSDLLYMLDVSVGTAAGDQSDRKQTYNDLFDVITRNVTNLSIQWADGDSVGTLSSASAGRLRYSQTAASSTGSFQVSENAAAYQNIIKGPVSAGNLTANLLPFATAGDVIGDTAWSQLGATTSRTTNFNASTPGTSLTSYGSFRLAVVDLTAFIPYAALGLWDQTIKTIFFGGTLAAPSNGTGSGTAIFRQTVSAQYSATPGQFNNGVDIRVRSSAVWSASEAGSVYEISTATSGTAATDLRFAINQQGCVIANPGTVTGVTTVGTLSIFQVGGSGYTVDNNALSFFADKATTGSTAIKNIVAQQKGSQTGALIETQSASGVAQFGLYPQVGTVCHFIVWQGSTNTPSVSAGASEGRLFFSTDGVLLRSQGQSDWGVVCGYENNNQVANYTVKVGDTGTFFSNQGALGSITFTLPAIPTATGGAGIVFVFYARTNQTIVLQLPASTVLRDGSGVTSAAGTATSTAQFDLIRIVGTRTAAGGNPEYVAESVRGAWTLA